MKHVYKYKCHLSSCHIGLSLSNVYVVAIVTSENYLENSMRNITNIKEWWLALRKSLQSLITLKMPDDTSGKYRAKCKHCTTNVTTCGMTTSNPLIHLKVTPFVLIDTWCSLE